MSYETSVMQSLTMALRDSDSLRMALREFNSNADVLERLAEAIEKQNELMEIQIQLQLNQSGSKSHKLTFEPITPLKK